MKSVAHYKSVAQLRRRLFYIFTSTLMRKSLVEKRNAYVFVIAKCIKRISRLYILKFVIM